MSHPFTGDFSEHRSLGVSPPRLGIVTFSEQRFYPSAAAPRDDDTRETSLQDLDVHDFTEASSSTDTLVASYVPQGVSNTANV